MWTVIKLFRGKLSEIHPVMYVISAAFVVYFIRTFLGVKV
jgi:adenine/guanine/hypoxanthine permease